MAVWTTELPLILQVMVNDIAGAVYSSDTLLKTLAVAARQVSLEMEFSQSFVITIASTPLIVPDPCDDASRDDSFNNLVTIKAACIIDRGAAILATKQGIAVKDGSSSIDLRDVSKGKLALLQSKDGWCSVYEDAKMEYKLGSTRIAGQMVIGPFRLFAQGAQGAIY